MSWFIERRLRNVGRRLQRARADLAVTDEQMLQLNEETDDAHVRSLTSDDLAAGQEHVEAERHRATMARHRADLVATIAQLEATQDELLDDLNARTTS